MPSLWLNTITGVPRRAMRRARNEARLLIRRGVDWRRPTVLSNEAFAAILSSTCSPPLPTVLSGLHEFIESRRLQERLATLPVDLDIELRQAANLAQKHEFDVLSSGPVNPNYTFRAGGFLGHRYSMSPDQAASERQRLRMATLITTTADFLHDSSPDSIHLVERVSDYDLIDWHLDFRSGYRWNSDTWYMDVPLAHLPGVDIKIPWELSRFHHVGSVALEYLRSGEHLLAQEICLEIVDWIAANPPRWSVNWRSAMDVAIRAANWTWALALLPEHIVPPSIHWIVAKSLYQHGQHIEAHLDYWPEHTNNHYLAEIVGLFVIGLAYAEFPDSDRWVLFALQELVSEMERTVNADGSSREGSTGYHCLVTEMFIHGACAALRLSDARRKRLICSAPAVLYGRLLPLAQQKFNLDSPRVLPDSFWASLQKMIRFVADVRKPNGLLPQWGDQDSGRFLKIPSSRDSEIPPQRAQAAHLLTAGSVLFGDSVKGNPPSEISLETILLSAGLAGEPQVMTEPSAASDFVCYSDGGFVVLRREPFWLGFRVGPLKDHKACGHMHNDRLAIELAVQGEDFIIDWGSGVYTADIALRNKLRSTESHSTVAVKSLEQNGWPAGLRGLFVLRERSYARIVEVSSDGIVAEHQGFGFMHRRRVRLLNGEIDVQDELGEEADTRLDMYSILTLAPAVSVVREKRGLRLEKGGVLLSLIPSDGIVDMDIREGLSSPRYGALVPSTKVVLRISGFRCRFQLRTQCWI